MHIAETVERRREADIVGQNGNLACPAFGHDAGIGSARIALAAGSVAG